MKSSSTIGRWLKTCLRLANIDVNVYQAHRTRSASTMKGAQLLPIDVVMKLAGWSQESLSGNFMISHWPLQTR